MDIKLPMQGAAGRVKLRQRVCLGQVLMHKILLQKVQGVIHEIDQESPVLETLSACRAQILTWIDRNIQKDKVSDERQVFNHWLEALNLEDAQERALHAEWPDLRNPKKEI